MSSVTKAIATPLLANSRNSATPISPCRNFKKTSCLSRRFRQGQTVACHKNVMNFIPPLMSDSFVALKPAQNP